MHNILTSLIMTGMMLVSDLSSKIWQWFLDFLPCRMKIICCLQKYNLFTLTARQKKLARCPLFYPFLKLVQINLYFLTIYIYYIYSLLTRHLFQNIPVYYYYLLSNFVFRLENSRVHQRLLPAICHA